VVLGHRTENTVEVFVVALGAGPVDHNVIKVEGHSWDPSEDGGHDFLGAA